MAFEDLLGTRDVNVYADFLLPFLDQTSHVLDLGCGDGVLAIGLASHTAQVTAVDLAPEDFAAAEVYAAIHEIPNLTFTEGDATRLAFEDATFDACFCHSLLEAGPDPAQVLAEVWRVLRPDGYVAVASTEYDGLILAGPDVDLLRRANGIREQLWQLAGADPFLGRELRRLVGRGGLRGRRGDDEGVQLRDAGAGAGVRRGQGGGVLGRRLRGVGRRGATRDRRRGRRDGEGVGRLGRVARGLCGVHLVPGGRPQTLTLTTGDRGVGG